MQVQQHPHFICEVQLLLTPAVLHLLKTIIRQAILAPTMGCEMVLC